MEVDVYRTEGDRVIITITIGFGEMQQRVKEESSHFAVSASLNDRCRTTLSIVNCQLSIINCQLSIVN